jgi:hypothetical protein
MAFSLSSLDGEDAPSSTGSFDMPAQHDLPASMGPPPDAAPAIARAPAKLKIQTAPLDLFAPPGGEEAEAAVELASDEVDDRARQRASAPPEAERPAVVRPATAPSSPQLTRKTPVSMPVASSPVTSLAARPELPRGHVIAGMVVSVLLAFVPVHFIAAMQERSAFAEIDRSVDRRQADADTLEDYAALDSFRDQQLDAKRSKRQMIALTSMLLWAVLAAGIAFAWFRKVPWDRLLARAS